MAIVMVAAGLLSLVGLVDPDAIPVVNALIVAAIVAVPVTWFAIELRARVRSRRG
jgi:hypothetical protein